MTRSAALSQLWIFVVKICEFLIIWLYSYLLIYPDCVHLSVVLLRCSSIRKVFFKIIITQAFIVLVQSDIFCSETRFVLIVSGVISCKQVSRCSSTANLATPWMLWNHSSSLALKCTVLVAQDQKFFTGLAWPKAVLPFWIEESGVPVSLPTKVQLYHTYIQPVLLYGSETSPFRSFKHVKDSKCQLSK